jgi:hypothetical protein
MPRCLGRSGSATNTTTQHQCIDGDTLERLLRDVCQTAEDIIPGDAAYLLAYVDTLRAEAVAESPNTGMIEGSTARLLARLGLRRAK